MNALRRFCTLSRDDRTLFILTFMLLTFVRLGLLTLALQRLCQLLATLSETARCLALPSYTLAQLTWAVNLSTRCIPGGAKCLARSLTLQTLMKLHGYRSELRIGFAIGEKGQLEAHAWIEHQGQVVIGQLDGLSRFTLLPPLQQERV